MTEPWQIHVCPVHGPRTPTMLGDCPVGCCAEVMEVVRVVRDTRGDGVGVVARYVRLGMNVGVPFDDGTEGLRHVIATARTNTHAEMIVRALNNRGRRRVRADA
jgi:hypothetical protein